jgi:hypothetical protein
LSQRRERLSRALLSQRDRRHGGVMAFEVRQTLALALALALGGDEG